MTMLATAFREAVKQTKDITKMNEMNYSVSYPTGFLNLDFANGYIQEVNGKSVFTLGISDGSINMLIGEPSTGKTSLLITVACNIVRQFKTSAVFFEQAEVGTNLQRIKNLSGFSDDEFFKRFIIRDSGITTESVYDRVRMIHDLKIKNQDDYLYDTGLKDGLGNPIYKFEPTIVIIDSLRMVLPQKGADANEVSNMSAAQTAKNNSEYFTKMVPICREANIIMIIVNHITQDINISFMPKKSELPYLRQNEHLGGSKMVVYLCNNIFRLDIKSKLKPEDGFKISGSVVTIDIVKSRTNKSGRGRCSLVFNQETGFDADLSLFLLLKEDKILEGSGAYLKIPGCDIKFSQASFKDALYSNPELYQAFIQTCFNHLSAGLMEEYNRIKQEESKRLGAKSAYESILDLVNQAQHQTVPVIESSDNNAEGDNYDNN